MKKSYAKLAVFFISVLFGMSTAIAASCSGQCVQYVKCAIPAYNKQYAQTKYGCDSKKTTSWVAARDIWLSLCTKSKGSSPSVGSVLVIDAFSGNSYGHVAIVTSVDGDKIGVKHSNWDKSNAESTGYFTKTSSGKVKYTTSSGTQWKTEYPLLGYIYTP